MAKKEKWLIQTCRSSDISHNYVQSASVSSPKHHTLIGWLTACDAATWFLLLIDWDATNRGLGLVLDFFLALSRTAPMAPEKPTISVEDLVETMVFMDPMRLCLTKLEGALEQSPLDVIEGLIYCCP